MHDIGSPTTWRHRVADLLDDPVAQAVMRRDHLTADQVFAILEPVAQALNAGSAKARAGSLGRSKATTPETRLF
ncbi:MAG: hypothetical protein P4M00_04055 [Azospirillaceae bacterium]|nr:hypothetical protein [Azospirillaceae bacterium]